MAVGFWDSGLNIPFLKSCHSRVARRGLTCLLPSDCKISRLFLLPRGLILRCVIVAFFKSISSAQDSYIFTACGYMVFMKFEKFLLSSSNSSVLCGPHLKTHGGHFLLCAAARSSPKCSSVVGGPSPGPFIVSRILFITCY